MPSNSTIGPQNSSSNNESGEFATLIGKDRINKVQTTAEVLSYLLNDSDPVSYTHLDVYKRQMLSIRKI